MAILKLAEKYSASSLNASCKKALTFTQTPQLSIIKVIINSKIYIDENDISENMPEDEKIDETKSNNNAYTRGAEYYKR